MRSRRFRNSGLNTCWSSSFTFSCIRSNDVVVSLNVKPSPLPLVMSRAPTSITSPSLTRRRARRASGTAAIPRQDMPVAVAEVLGTS